ncbi:hypothetical protein KUTeg_005075 [Tegillarca granosa]|uniref:RING-type domain-containing protein n=1 Tax=Tegillarca granosa TaxID=220873 RepID=A0ABQ9FLW0_TEGGR|nr:hypothetical protein KUTeg_005075 [Tegillarca granosa]
MSQKNRCPRTPRSLPSLNHVRRLRDGHRRCGSSWREVNCGASGSNSSTNTSNGMIDLTASGDEDYIDLTSPNGLRENRMPVVIRRSKRQLATTTCGHIFCSTCIRRAVTSQHACPTCRKKLTLKQIIPLFI